MLKINHEFSDLHIEQLKKYRDQSKDIRVKERILSIIMYVTLSISTLLIAEIFGKTERIQGLNPNSPNTQFKVCPTQLPFL